MKPYAAQFYSSKAWQDCRSSYLQSVGGLCEICLSKGIYTPAEIVHHKIPIDPSNITNPQITLSFENLLAVCREHHAELHGARQRRYAVDETGKVLIKE